MQGQGAQVGEAAGVCAFIDHAADDGEEQAGDDAVREHLEHRTAHGGGVGRGESEQHEAHVAHARVADDKLEVLLHECHQAGVDNADDGQPRDVRLEQGEGLG